MEYINTDVRPSMMYFKVQNTTATSIIEAVSNHSKFEVGYSTDDKFHFYFMGNAKSKLISYIMCRINGRWVLNGKIINYKGLLKLEPNLTYDYMFSMLEIQVSKTHEWDSVDSYHIARGFINIEELRVINYSRNFGLAFPAMVNTLKDLFLELTKLASFRRISYSGVRIKETKSNNPDDLFNVRRKLRGMKGINLTVYKQEDYEQQLGMFKYIVFIPEPYLKDLGITTLAGLYDYQSGKEDVCDSIMEDSLRLCFMHKVMGSGKFKQVLNLMMHEDQGMVNT